MLMAANPTPSVMPTKNFPSRVRLQGGGGPGIGFPRQAGAPSRRARLRRRLSRSAWQPQRGTGTRATSSRTAVSASSRAWGWKPSACVAGRTRCERTGTARSWMSSADAVVAAAEEALRRRRRCRGRSRPEARRRGKVRGTERVAWMSAWEVIAEPRSRASTRWTSRCRATSLAGSSTTGNNVARGVGVSVEQEAHFDLRRRVADSNPDEKAVQLRLGEGKGAREILGVLRGDDEERIGQRDGLAVERDLPFVHRFEQRGLRARARAVDLVREEDVREDGAVAEDELARALIEDGDAEHIARQEIACELDATEVPSHGPRERAREGGLADAGNVLDQQVAAREQRDQGKLRRRPASLRAHLRRPVAIVGARGAARRLTRPQRSWC